MLKTLIQYPNGGKIDIYKFVDKSANDYTNVFKCCEYFAMQGAHTIIYPQFSVTIGNISYEHIFVSLKGTQYWGRCPDFTVNGVWYEHEGFDTSEKFTDPLKRAYKFRKMMKRGVKQSDRIIVEDTGVWRHWAKRNVHDRVHRDKQNITEVYIRTDDGLELIYKSKAD